MKLTTVIITTTATATTTFVRGICDYIPETNHISVIYSVAAVPCLQFAVHYYYYCYY
jgi:hypothetical protein